MHADLHVYYPLILSRFNGTGIFSTDFRKIYEQFHENLSRGSRAFPCGRTEGQREIYKTKIIAFRNIADASKHNSFNAVQQIIPSLL
jgi:hypothetical protein